MSIKKICSEDTFTFFNIFEKHFLNVFQLFTCTAATPLLSHFCFLLAIIILSSSFNSQTSFWWFKVKNAIIIKKKKKKNIVLYITWAFAPASACNICWTNCWWLGSVDPDAGLVFSLGTELETVDPVGVPVLPSPPKPGLNLHKRQKEIPHLNNKHKHNYNVSSDPKLNNQVKILPNTEWLTILVAY